MFVVSTQGIRNPLAKPWFADASAWHGVTINHKVIKKPNVAVFKFASDKVVGLLTGNTRPHMVF